MKKSPGILLLTGVLIVATGLAGCSGPPRTENANPPDNSNSAAKAIEDPAEINLTEEIKPIKLGDGTVDVCVSKRGSEAPAFVYFNMHDNENTSVGAARIAINRHGGRLVEIRSTGRRNIDFSLGGKKYTFDPNRIFTDEGIRKTLAEHGPYSAEAHKETARFANQLIKDYFIDAKLVIAAHNNTEAEYSIHSYYPGGEYEKDAAEVFVNKGYDADDFFFVTDAAHYEILVAAGFNVALQDNKNVVDDGSFSVYCGRNNIKYINVEAEHGHLFEQVQMIESLRTIIQQP
jgi:hypothetical protein